ACRSRSASRRSKAARITCSKTARRPAPSALRATANPADVRNLIRSGRARSESNGPPDLTSGPWHSPCSPLLDPLAELQRLFRALAAAHEPGALLCPPGANLFDGPAIAMVGDRAGGLEIKDVPLVDRRTQV